MRTLQGYLERLHGLYAHPNRVLFYDDVVTVYLLAFFNPTLRSLRCIEDASRLPGVNRFLNVEAVCKSTLADANELFDPAHLAGLVADLRARLPNLAQADGDLAHLLDRVVAADGSFFRLAADVAWAVRSRNQHSKASGAAAGRHVRLNCQFCLKTGVPAGVSVNGGDGVGEGAAAAALVEAGHIYLFDSGVVSFPYLAAILAAGSDFLCNLAAGVNFAATGERPLTDRDRAAGVVGDRVGRLGGSDTRTPPDAVLREVRVCYTARDGSGRTLRLLTDLLDLPACVIAELYRYRWQVEMHHPYCLHCNGLYHHAGRGLGRVRSAA